MSVIPPQTTEAPVAYAETSYRGYRPEDPDEDERKRQFEQKAINDLNEIVELDEVRAEERYGKGLFGKARQFFRREGKRVEAQTLDDVAEWNESPKWRKWAETGLKVAGGAGLATAMVMTGGLGAILTPILWSLGAREAIDGGLKMIEDMKWGKARTEAELLSQSAQSVKIAQFKEAIRSGNINETSYLRMMNEIIEADNKVMATQSKNMHGEKVGKAVRGVASTVLTMGAGIFGGIPTGVLNTGVMPAGAPIEAAHRTMWSLTHGASFLYNSAPEMAKVGQHVNTFNDAWYHFGDLASAFFQQGHVMGHGLNAVQQAGLVGAALAPIARVLGDYAGNQQSARGYRTQSPDRYATNASYVSNLQRRNATPEAGTAPAERSFEADQAATEQYQQTFTPDYTAELEATAEELPAMSENCIVAVCIPAAYNEQHLTRILEQYSNQIDPDTGEALAADKYEIALFINGTPGTESEIEARAQEVIEFTQRTGIPVRLVSKVYPTRAPIGEIRKFVNDLSVLRGNKRAKASGPLTLVSNDADSVIIPPDYLMRITSAFDNDKKLEVIAGKDDYLAEDYQRYPYLHAARRLWQYTDAVQRYGKYGGSVPKALGRNSAIRASSYAEIKGYNSQDKVAEDLRLGNEVAHKSGVGSVKYKNIPIYADPRRDLDQIQKGKPLVRGYDTFHEDSSLRDGLVAVDNVETLTPDNPLFIERLNQDAKALLSEIWQQKFWDRFNEHPEVVARRSANRNANVMDLITRLRGEQINKDSFEDAQKIFNKACDLWGATVDSDALPNRSAQDFQVNVAIRDWSKLRSGLEGTRRSAIGRADQSVEPDPTASEEPADEEVVVEAPPTSSPVSTETVKSADEVTAAEQVIERFQTEHEPIVGNMGMARVRRLAFEAWRNAPDDGRFVMYASSGDDLSRVRQQLESLSSRPKAKVKVLLSIPFDQYVSNGVSDELAALGREFPQLTTTGRLRENIDFSSYLNALSESGRYRGSEVEVVNFTPKS